ncbi:myosin light chain kinase, smooth muscle-like [Paramuricea clavata]|uniref:Myosin light chain kinase, smooth muscle-like n=1 Tax=Paramuricea clavata TaxID=317549 RepID=A0A6S7K9G0_PARCT|nr:myosin light chain kinase, smooth muscle-like [Paramuricea clavata]
MKALCKNGYCYCNGKYYDYDTCLPDAYGCKIFSNSDTTYTCTPENSSPLYEVHVLAVYEVINRRPPRAGNARVNIISRGKCNRPIVLVLASYEPVNWILNIPSDITISKVILVSYYIDESSVSGDVSRVKIVERKGTRNSDWDSGYGSDSGGGDTVELLKQIDKRFGVVTSFRGTYRTNQWSLELSPFNGNVNVEANNGGNSNSGYDENTKSSESDQNLYYLLFISVPLIIGLGN